MKKFYLTACLFISYFFGNAQWNSSTTVNTTVSTVNSSDVQTIGLKDGRTYVAYYSLNNGNYYMRAQLLDARGNRMFSDTGILVSQRKAGSATFVFNVCVDNNKNLYVAFQYDKSGTQTAIMNAVNTSGKLLWGTNGIELGTGLAPYPKALTNGDIAVAWNDNSGNINYQIVTPAGIQLWGTPKQITGNVSSPQLVVHKDSTFGMIYQKIISAPSYTNLYEQRFDHDGNALWASPVQLTDYVTASYHYYSVLAISNTTYVGYYGNPSGQNRFDALLQRVNGDGSLPWGSEGSHFASYTAPTDPYQLNLNIAYDKNTSVLWGVTTISDFNQTNYGIALQKFKTTNGAVGLGANGKNIFDINANSQQQQGALALCGTDPIFTYTDVTNKLYATKVDTAGNFVWSGNSVELGSTTNSKSRFGFTQVINNQAVAVWQENKDGEDKPYAQNITCDGITGTVLPISLANFKGEIRNGVVNLYWQTLTESNNKGFNIQRSTDAVNFSNIAFVASKAVNGNSSAVISYSAADVKPFSGSNYYRLQQIDNDGRATTSNVILIKTSTIISQLMHSVYPNPVHSLLNIYVESTVTETASFIVTDASGKIIRTQNTQLVNGNNNITINVAGLTSGSYIVKMITKDHYENAIQHFVKLQ